MIPARGVQQTGRPNAFLAPLLPVPRDLLGDEGRAVQRRIEAALDRDPDYRAWAAAKHLDRWGTEHPHPEPEAGR